MSPLYYDLLRSNNGNSALLLAQFPQPRPSRFDGARSTAATLFRSPTPPRPSVPRARSASCGAVGRPTRSRLNAARHRRGGHGVKTSSHSAPAASAAVRRRTVNYRHARRELRRRRIREVRALEPRTSSTRRAAVVSKNVPTWQPTRSLKFVSLAKMVLRSEKRRGDRGFSRRPRRPRPGPCAGPEARRIHCQLACRRKAFSAITRSPTIAITQPIACPMERATGRAFDSFRPANGWECSVHSISSSGGSQMCGSGCTCSRERLPRKVF